jgi:acetyl esterase/lipase
MLVLGFLLHVGDESRSHGQEGHDLPRPFLGVLISPWTTLVSPRHKNTQSDYLDIHQLERYGRQLAGDNIAVDDPLVSPGCCKDLSWWKRASPTQGMFITYGGDEVFAPEIDELIGLLREAGVLAGSVRAAGGIHAWPVASIFLSSERSARLKGLRAITEEIRDRIPHQ